MAVVDLVSGPETHINFCLPVGVDPLDDAKMIRLTKLFFPVVGLARRCPLEPGAGAPLVKCPEANQRRSLN